LTSGFSSSADLQALFDNLLDSGRLHALAINSDGFVFDPQSGQSFNINGTGLRALHLMRDTRSLERSCAGLCRQYDVPFAIVCGSIEVFVRQLARHLR